VPWNLFTYSEQPNNADWIGGGSGRPTMTDNFATAPNGTTTASKMEVAGSGYQLRQNKAQENTQMTISVWLRTNTGTKTIRLILNDGVAAYLDITVTTTWTRYEVSGLVTTLSGSGRCGLQTMEALTSGAYILVWGAQLNIGSTAKPYFPTTDRLNVPRLTYQNGGGGCPSLLLEKQSTNLVLQSENWGTYWVVQNISASVNQTTSPDGTTNADLLTTTNTGICYTYQYLSGTSGAYSTSVFVKNGNNNFFALNVQNASTQWVSAIFDLSDGSLGEYAQGSGGAFVYTSHTITSVGDGWYRCVLNYTTTQSTYICPMFAPLKTGNSFTSSYGEVDNNANNKTLYIWGAQLEASSYPTSYIPTTSASATRVADECSKTGISSLIGQTSGVLFADINRTQKSENYNVPIFVGSGNNFIQLYFRSTNDLVGQVYTSAAQQVAIISSALANGRYKIALAYASNDFAMYINGTQIGTDTSGTVPTCSQVIIGNDDSGNFSYNDSINQAILFPTRLTNAELASLTTL